MHYSAYLFCFFFNDTATTEIYTYLTHSFPTRRSSDLDPRRRRRCRRVCPEQPRTRSVGALHRRPRVRVTPERPETGNHPCRSEEHTSELQSLMRISYAVFCLKKKKKTNTTNQENRQTGNNKHKHNQTP